MLAVLDPYLLHFDDAALAPLPRETLADIVRMLARNGASIPDEPSYWQPLAREYLARLDKRMSADPMYRRDLDQLRRLVVPVDLAPAARARLTGFDVMFDPLGPEWGKRMRSIVARAASTDATILVTRLVPNRNARRHDHDGKLALVEKPCWELRVVVANTAHHVACVCNSRNERVRWTCRYADALAGHEDDAEFPFCAAGDWQDPGRAAFRTHESRPCWSDALGHFWAEPRTQEEERPSYHWDVYLTRAAHERYGLSPLNIAKWRANFARDAQPQPGALHHVSDRKRGRLLTETGWTC